MPSWKWIYLIGAILSNILRFVRENVVQSFIELLLCQSADFEPNPTPSPLQAECVIILLRKEREGNHGNPKSDGFLHAK